jgi:hypothetical protein
MSVYKSINAVQAALARTGISKANRNQTQGYNFRGIDDVYNALSPLLAEHGLCILPRVLARTVAEHPSKNGGVLFYVTVEVEFDFVCAQDGSKHTVKTFGEAMDSGDKATNKAMSAAYKYAAMQAFAIPTEGDNDADAHTHEVAFCEDPRRVSFLIDTKAAIDGAANAGELKKIVAETLGKATSLNDTDAANQINAWVDAKVAKAKPKAVVRDEVTA